MTSATAIDPIFGLARIGQIGVAVHDLDRAVAFYRDTLGMRFLFRAPNLAFFDCDGLRLMLGLPERPEHDHPASILYYTVGDLHAAHATLLSRGVTCLDAPHLIARMPDHELWMAFFIDTEGNTLGLMSEVR
jgi:catechol 2,3-dioxygenase-like lactoylglutathione lyase family enzyme